MFYFCIGWMGHLGLVLTQHLLQVHAQVRKVNSQFLVPSQGLQGGRVTPPPTQEEEQVLEEEEDGWTWVRSRRVRRPVWWRGRSGAPGCTGSEPNQSPSSGVRTSKVLAWSVLGAGSDAFSLQWTMCWPVDVIANDIVSSVLLSKDLELVNN